jgi:dephospho-CoA kinase
MQRVIGITGGIGSGKSTIAKELAKRGFVIYDCDREAKRIILENAEVRKAIIELLGDEAFAGGVYNTAYVAQRVFAEPDLLRQLNGIVHPAVKKDILLSAVRCQPSGVLFVESAILFEAGLDGLCEGIVLVDAPEEVRIARTIARDYKGEASPENINKVRARVKSQLSEFSFQPSENKKALRVNNDGRTSISELADIIVRQYCAAS